MRWKSGPLAMSNDILVLNGFVNTIDWNQNQSDLSDLTLSMRRVTGSPWIADFRSWTWPEVAIPVANQKDRGLWERDWKNPRIAGFFAALPFLTYLCHKRLKPSTHCVQLRRKIATMERAQNDRCINATFVFAILVHVLNRISKSACENCVRPPWSMLIFFIFCLSLHMSFYIFYRTVVMDLGPLSKQVSDCTGNELRGSDILKRLPW